MREKNEKETGRNESETRERFVDKGDERFADDEQRRFENETEELFDDR